MALKPDLISFFLRNIQRANMQTFGSEVAHLFEHLENEIKDNPIYNFYEKEREKWENWLDENTSSWSLPTKFEDAKSLVYDLYKTIGEQGEKGYNLPMNLTYVSHGDINDSIHDFNNQFIEYFQEVLQEIVNANPEIENNQIKKVTGDTVFIVHGHDNELKTEVQLLLTRAGVNNIVLHEQADKGRTIIDKLVDESTGSNYAIALLSPDDKLEDGSTRARQNVILEIGYFIGQLGKERVRLLKKGDTEIPSDLQGILYENYDNAGAWKMKICKELIAVGIFVDIKSIADTL
ncbi:MAG: nucleotide-binding protein [Melioribacteraceae bacterium]|nr:nucleotide-binding protein [Melioribacteraceae bacterium]MCF8394403.1 nucleotide-binding protein [Melioribacteraceae bacterium]MCF8417501.1 nucleotide-binding protein [Melioribacteraceae bacterium]